MLLITSCVDQRLISEQDWKLRPTPRKPGIWLCPPSSRLANKTRQYPQRCNRDSVGQQTDTQTSHGFFLYPPHWCATSRAKNRWVLHPCSSPVEFGLWLTWWAKKIYCYNIHIYIYIFYTIYIYYISIISFIMMIYYLVGGFNPSEKYWSLGRIIIPYIMENKNVWNHLPPTSSDLMWLWTWITNPMRIKTLCSSHVSTTEPPWDCKAKTWLPACSVSKSSHPCASNPFTRTNNW